MRSPTRQHAAIPHLPDQRQQHFEALAAHHRQLEVWAEHCPENFENRAALVGAEIARIEGRELDARTFTNRPSARRSANGFVHNEALANELAARFYAARGFEKIAHPICGTPGTATFVGEPMARYGNSSDCIRTSERKSPHRSDEHDRASVEHLDLATVIKVSQAISGEIVWRN